MQMQFVNQIECVEDWIRSNHVCIAIARSLDGKYLPLILDFLIEKKKMYASLGNELKENRIKKKDNGGDGVCNGSMRKKSDEYNGKTEYCISKR